MSVTIILCNKINGTSQLRRMIRFVKKWRNDKYANSTLDHEIPVMKWPLVKSKFQEITTFSFLLNFNTGYRGRASDLTVPGLGHSVIRGLVTYRSMVRRESCRLLAWIKIYKYNVNRGISQIIRTQECSKTPPLYPVWISCFRRWNLTKSVSSAWLLIRIVR